MEHKESNGSSLTLEKGTLLRRAEIHKKNGKKLTVSSLERRGGRQNKKQGQVHATIKSEGRRKEGQKTMGLQ